MIQRKAVCACGGDCAGCKEELHESHVQTKLVISTPEDPLEQEADRVADQVMRMPNPRVQRACACGGSCPACATKPEKRLQTKRVEGSGALPHMVNAVVAAPGQPLDEGVRAFMEPRFGHDFSGVRIHTDASAAESARAVNALAYALGRDIVFDAGQYATETDVGRLLLAHELAHVVQQSSDIADSGSRLQRAVRFRADFPNVTLTSGTAATIAGTTFHYHDANFAADANVTAVGDTAAELADWDVGILQDEVAGWEQYYWLRNNADRKGRFVAKKFLGGQVARRDQAAGATTEWDADSEHTLLSSVPAAPAAGKFEASTTVTTSDSPGGPDTTDGGAVSGMDATDGTLNIRTFRSGGRFQTWISAHNITTGEWRHLRWVNWNYMHSLDFSGSGGTLAVGPESWSIGHYGPHSGGASPLLTGDTANTVYNDPAHWSIRRDNG